MGEIVDKRDLDEAVRGFIKSSELHFALHEAMESQLDLLKSRFGELEGALVAIRNEIAFLIDVRKR